MRDAPIRTRRTEQGFTLIELMVVVLIIAILIAIAIPTFLGARQRSQNTAARADLRNAMIAAQVHYTQTEDYQLLTAAILKGIEPNLDYDANVSNSSDETIGFTDAGLDSLVMVRKSKAGDYFCMAQTGTGTTFGRDADLASVDTVVDCVQGWD